MNSPTEDIEVSTDDHTLPVMDVVTGRGFITGKSGSGKSNTASVIAEELLEQGLTIVIVDTDGEYFGLKEKYELLHVGGDDTCDVTVTVEHAESLARLAIEENVPIILDVSAYLDPTEADTLIESFVRQLFVKEKSAKKPLLVFVEEIHEYIPEKSGLDDLGETLVQVAKRGRKRGLGLCGMSQRPAAVDKDFITQCNWIVWHRLTWENDTKVAGRIMDPEYAETVQELDDGEGYLMTDWDEQVRRVKFRRKRTFDAGSTPGLEDYDPPDMRSVKSGFIEELQAVGSGTTAIEPDTITDDADDQHSSLSDEQPSNGKDRPAESKAATVVPSSDSPSEEVQTETQRAEQRRADGLAVEFAHLVVHLFDRMVAAVVAASYRGLETAGIRSNQRVVLESRQGQQEPPTFGAAVAIVFFVLLSLLLIGVLITL